MQITRSRTITVLAALALTALLAVEAGAASAGTRPSVSKLERSKHGKRALVKLRSTVYGKVLVDAHGHTLYLYTPDRRGRSACYGRCASLWPPLLTTGKPRVGSGVEGRLLGVTMRKGGKRQVTYAGHPLYRFSQDKKPGQVKGEGARKIWYVLSTAGRKVEKRVATSTTPTTTTTSSGWGSSGY